MAAVGNTKGRSEFAVLAKAKSLGSYVFEVTGKSPKKFRGTSVYRLQDLSLGVVEGIYRANAIRIVHDDGPSAHGVHQRAQLQDSAILDLKTLCYLSMLAAEQGCLLFKQYECISKQADEVSRLLFSWSKSDRRRYGG